MTGTELKALRKQRGLTNRELATILDVGIRAVESYLSGTRGMSPDVALRAAQLQDPTRCPTCGQRVTQQKERP